MAWNPILRLALPLVRQHTLRRAMSTTLERGQILQGPIWNYQVTEVFPAHATHASLVAKADVIPHSGVVGEHPKHAIVKLAVDDRSKQGLSREIEAYRIPGVESSESFRRRYRVHGEHIMALEWLELTLADLPYNAIRPMFYIIKEVFHASISSCIVLENQNYVNTDFKSSNILLSLQETGQLVAKVGDLGSVHQANKFYNGQPYAMRAPEVFLHQRVAEPAQVWAVAAMLLVWMKPGFFGGKSASSSNEAWCIAKFMKLFPDWRLPSPNEINNKNLKNVITEVLALDETLQPAEKELLQQIAPFEEEIGKVNMPQELRDLLGIMLIPDPQKRPSASNVLASSQYQTFLKFIDGLSAQ